MTTRNQAPARTGGNPDRKLFDTHLKKAITATRWAYNTLNSSAKKKPVDKKQPPK